MTQSKSVMETKRNELGVSAGFPEETTYETAPCPPAFLEYTWYVLLAYAMLGQAWGVVIPSVGGALLALLAAACFLSVGVQTPRVYAPVALALCTGVSVIAIQFLFFSELSLANAYVIGFIGWLFTVIIVQTLSLRPWFLYRFALAAFAIGLSVLPYLQLQKGAALARVQASGTGISNPNMLGMWFGFCTIYFLFWGMQSRTLILRAIYWAGALGSLYMVALTVSRGPMLGILVACIVGFHSELKRSFLPVLSLVLLIWLVYESGVFQQSIDSYIVRGTEESGRGDVWPVVLQRLFDSLWTGVGLGAIYTSVAGRHLTPHNGLLFIGLAAGIIPVMCYLGYLARALSGALHIMWRVHAGEATLFPPLVTFALIELMINDFAFMSAWVVVVFALVAVKRTPLPGT
jgi:hypothetical protein